MFRCFTFGIGSGASTELVEGLATAGKGSVEFVKEGERLQPKVSYCFSPQSSHGNSKSVDPHFQSVWNLPNHDLK